MLWRVAQGDIPAKHHIAHRGPGGALRWEECITRAGFDGSYTIAYHVYRPHEQMVAPELASRGWRAPVAVGLDAPLEKRHFKTQDLKPQGGTALDATEILLFNDDLEVGLVTPTITDDIFRIDGDMDTLLFIYRGKGYVETPLGDLRFETDDYVCIPKGIAHRIHVEDGVEQRYLHLGVQDLDLLKQWRNTSGQLTMDAPYCHRDFRLPELKPVDPSEEGRPRQMVVRRDGRWHGFTLRHSPCDVVGWDGAVYPWAFPILNFQPRAGLVHLPPTWHGTFGVRGGLVCSFVPRTVDFHPEAIPCPYPHSSVDVDEFLFYVRGNFTSRRGVDSGSISLHPRGIPHGPHPGAYEASIGHDTTTELAVMLDVTGTLRWTEAALAIADPGYHDSFLE